MLLNSLRSLKIMNFNNSKVHFDQISYYKVKISFNHGLLQFQMDGATYKSKTTFSGGGVARNIAEGLCKLYGSAALISAFGVDQNGSYLKSTLPAEATVSSTTINTHPTANCAVVLDNSGDCKLVVGDMSIHQEITPDLIYKNAALIEKCPLIVLDANLSYEALEAALKLAHKYKKPGELFELFLKIFFIYLFIFS